MAFSKVNPSGWSTSDRITPSQINTIDENVVKALDGTNGGTYTPSSQIDISGEGISIDPMVYATCESLRMTGTHGVRKRVQSLGIFAIDAVRVDVTRDVYIIRLASACNGLILNVTDPMYVTPDHGEVITAVVLDTNEPGTSGMPIFSDSISGTALDYVALVNPNTSPTGPPQWASFVYDSTFGRWRCIAHNK